MAAVVFATVCAFGLGRKCWRRIKAVSDPMCYGLTKTPFQQSTINISNKAFTNQAGPELVSPPVPSSITNAAPAVVPDGNQAAPELAANLPMANNNASNATNNAAAPQGPVVALNATATVTVSRRLPGPKAANMEKIGAEVVKKDNEHYNKLRACRLQNEGCKWYQDAYNCATAQWLPPPSYKATGLRKQLGL